MNKYKNQIVELCMGQPVGETSSNMECPMCRGGSTKEKSFSITREASGILFNCYRATCGFKGFYPTKYVDNTERKKKEFTPHKYNYYLSPLRDKDIFMFSGTYGISRDELESNRVKYNREKNTYAFPLFTPERWEFGVVDRAYWGRKPKAISYFFSERAKIHFPIQEFDGDKPILLVEDILSSIKACRYVNSAALLGTNLTTSMVNQLLNLTQKVVVALDEDATSKAIGMKRKYSIYFKNFSIIPLSKDIKNMDDADIKSLLGDIDEI